jgi:crotonobetaine/carnitine-CoA ligase
MEKQRLKRELDDMGLLVRQFETWARKRPDKTFFYYGEEDRHYTYDEFNRMANCIANNLKAMGVSKGDRVSLFLKSPLVTILSMFALWKLGAVFCPTNFLYKGRLLSYQLNDTDPKLLIMENGREPLLNDIKEHIQCHRVALYLPEPGRHDFDPGSADFKLDDRFQVTPFSELVKGNDENPGVEINYWDTANIVYTSGTTGPPKGVVQSHRWLQNYCFYGVKLLHPDDVVYCDLPLYHVGGAFSLVGRAAWRGCTVAVWDRFSASEFWARIHQSGASYTLLLDVVMPWLMKHEPTENDRNNTLRRVHMQPLPEYHHEFAKRFGIDFVNVGYGATEIGYVCAGIIDETLDGGGTPEGYQKGYSREEVLRVASELQMPVAPGDQPIKKGFMGTPCLLHEMAVLNDRDEELGPGEYGQIGLRSRLPYVLLNEYFNKPEATAEAFRNLWFHTGDGAYRDPSGHCYFVDRMGGFIRVKGENISSFQVEDFANTHPEIQMSAAFSIPAAEGLEDDIVVYVVPVAGCTLEEEKVRVWTRREMPKYMWPKHIRVVEALPQTPTHKVEKYKLRERILKEIAGG